MKHLLKRFLKGINYIRFIPHVFILYFHPQKKLLLHEKDVWVKTILNIDDDQGLSNFLWLLKYVPEYRSLFYFRIGKKNLLFLFFLAKARESFYLNMQSSNVGIGLVIQHGFSTIIEAISIGENCQIWHNVTIGTNISHSGNKPTIGNNVKVCTGAIILGKVKIGNNVIIGAGTLIVKDVPNNCTVIGNPAVIIKKEGIRVNLKL